MEVLLESQNCVFEKLVWSTNLNKNQNKVVQSFLNIVKHTPFVTWFYWFRIGHSVINFIVKKYDIPNDLVRRVPKSTYNNFGIEIYKGIKPCNVNLFCKSL